jgi:choline dehydrogenase-like flavoprotein
MPQATNYDAIVIGSGRGGRLLPIALAKAGRKVALIERSHAVRGGWRDNDDHPGGDDGQAALHCLIKRVSSRIQPWLKGSIICL